MGKLNISNLTKAYESNEMESIVAVDNLNLEIEEGEFVVLVGPSGCGKTTTLRCIAGLETPESGKIELDGVDISKRKASDRNMAMVFQNFALYPHMSVEQNISFGLRLSGEFSDAEIDERIKEATEMLEIGELLPKKPGQLSGGQKQRVALGRAIVREPEIFLFDEPLSNLDAKLRTNMRSELQQLQNKLGITSIYVTHDQTEAMTMSDRIVILDGGKLQQVGTPMEIYNNPDNKFVASFVGDPGINLTDAILETTESGHRIMFGEDYYTVSDKIAELVYPGKVITVGIRPEDLRIIGPKLTNSDAKCLKATVKLIETMGDENLIYYEINNTEFIGKGSPKHKPPVGQEVYLTFDESDLYIFDANDSTIKSKQFGV
jgi:multiple sugar transport system ATP-binding protein